MKREKRVEERILCVPCGPPRDVFLTISIVRTTSRGSESPRSVAENASYRVAALRKRVRIASYFAPPVSSVVSPLRNVAGL
ncbi:hypothetical protein KM043_007598 [Ampulex compressa]|nr:hypothetical protein KM043_007598 [Ampulex compressa]